MALKIAVLKTFLPNCPSPYIVRSASSELVEFDRFVDFMAEGRTTLSRIDILAAMQLFKEELQKQLAEGKTVKTPIGSFYMSAAGSMGSLDEPYLPKEQHEQPRAAPPPQARTGLRAVDRGRPRDIPRGKA